MLGFLVFGSFRIVSVVDRVTGPPSLAQVTQRIAHNWLPEFNRPTDWSREIRFEPGAVVGYEHRERMLAYTAGEVP